MKILLVEDSKRLQLFLSNGLRREGFAVDTAGDGEEGLWYAESFEYDVIILDIMLPEVDGLTILRSLRRQHKKVHILMLTARDTVADRVLGLKAGADDYLTKPFAFEELLARIDALVRRHYHQKNPVVSVGSLVLDTSAKKMTISGKPLVLQPREYAMLEYLVRRQGQLVTRSEIEQHLYDENRDLHSNAVDSCICAIRKKLKVMGIPSMIHTYRGKGYTLGEIGT